LPKLTLPNIQQITGTVFSLCGLANTGVIQCSMAGGETPWTMELSPPKEAAVPLHRLASERFWLVALDANGAVWMWSLTGGTGNAPKAIRLGGLPRFRDISVGDDYGCGVEDEGTVTCWGEVPPQVARSTQEDSLPFRRQAVRICGVHDATAVAAGDDHACILRRTGTLLCFGEAHDGQLGGNPRQHCNDLPAAGGLHDVKEVVAGRGFTCVTLGSGEARCFGDGGEKVPSDTSPPDLDAIPKRAKASRAIASGAEFACSLEKDGRIWCWGAGFSERSLEAFGEWGGVGSSTVDAAAGATAIFAGGTTLCAVMPERKLACFARIATEEPGRSAWSAPLVLPLPQGARRISVTDAELTVVDEEGGVEKVEFTFGRHGGSPLQLERRYSIARTQKVDAIADDGCTLSQGTITCPSTSDRVSPALASILDFEDSWILLRDGRGLLFPHHGEGFPLMEGLLSLVSVGLISPPDHSKTGPAVIPVPQVTEAVELVAKYDHVCFRRANGAVVCFGNNQEGEITGTPSHVGLREPLAPRLGGTAVQLSMGRHHTCARLATGAVECWGRMGDIMLAPLKAGTPKPVEF
jgi:alpha-tubulin suppressor-like RCC1 family protein